MNYELRITSYELEKAHVLWICTFLKDHRKGALLREKRKGVAKKDISSELLLRRFTAFIAVYILVFFIKLILKSKRGTVAICYGQRTLH